MAEKQIEMFPRPPPDKDDELNAAIAADRLARMQRDESRRSRHRHAYGAKREGNRAKLTCPGCGHSVAIAVVT